MENNENDLLVLKNTHSEQIAMIKELLMSGVFDKKEFIDAITEINNSFISSIEKIETKKLELKASLEDSSLYYKTKLEEIRIMTENSIRPKSFGELICDTTSNIAKGLTAFEKIQHPSKPLSDSPDSVHKPTLV